MEEYISSNGIINEEKEDLLKKIFYYDNNLGYVGIVKDTKPIPQFLLVLYTNDNLEDLHSLIKSLTLLISNCSYISSLLSSFMLPDPFPQLTFHHIIIHLYLKHSNNMTILNSIEILIKIILTNSSFHHSIYEIIYQSLSNKYYHSTSTSSTPQLLSNVDYAFYHKLLSLLFEYNQPINRNHFLYFTGKGKLHADFEEIKYKSKTSNALPIALNKLNNGFTTIFWVNTQYCKKDLESVDERKRETILFTFKSNKTKIQLYLMEGNGIGLEINGRFKEDFGRGKKKEDGEYRIKERKWYQFVLRIRRASTGGLLGGSGLVVYLQINDDGNERMILKTEPMQNLSLDGEILFMSFYENYIGMAKSVYCFNDDFNATHHDKDIIIPFNYGFHSMNQFNNSLHNSYPNFFPLKDNITSYHLLPKEITDKILLVYHPYIYQESRKTVKLEDIGLYRINGKIKCPTHYSNGIQYDHFNQGRLIQSILDLLPLFELIYLNKTMFLDVTIVKSFFDLVEKLLSKSSIEVLTQNKEQIIKFFSLIGLFMKKLPREFYTADFIDYLIEIGQRLFQSFSSELFIKYFDHIVFRQLFHYYTNPTTNSHVDINIILTLIMANNADKVIPCIDIKDLCSLLIKCDEQCLINQCYCCERHLFIKEAKQILSPSLPSQINPLIHMIKTSLHNSSSSSSSILSTLLDMLTIPSLSPCIHKEIINIFKDFFLSNNNQQDHLINLFKHKVIEIILFTFTNSLLDIKGDILNLLHIIDRNYSNGIKDYVNFIIKDVNWLDNLLEHIRENIVIKIPFPCNDEKDDDLQLELIIDYSKKLQGSNHSSTTHLEESLKPKDNTTTSLDNEEVMDMMGFHSPIKKDSMEWSRIKARFSYNKESSLPENNCINRHSSMTAFFDEHNTSVKQQSRKSEGKSIESNDTMNNNPSERKNSGNSDSNQLNYKELITRRNSSLSSLYTKSPRQYQYFHSIDYTSSIQKANISALYHELVSWLKYSIECKGGNQRKSSLLINCIIKLLVETKRIDLISLFIVFIKEIMVNDDNGGIWNDDSLYIWVIETMFHIYLIVKEEVLGNHRRCSFEDVDDWKTIKNTEEGSTMMKLKEIYNKAKEIIGDIVKGYDKVNNGGRQMRHVNYLITWGLKQKNIYAERNDTEKFINYIDRFLCEIFGMIMGIFDKDAIDNEINFNMKSMISKNTLINHYLIFISNLYEMICIHFDMNGCKFISKHNDYFIPYVNIDNDDNKLVYDNLGKWSYYNLFNSIYENTKQSWDYHFLCKITNDDKDKDSHHIKLIIEFYSKLSTKEASKIMNKMNQILFIQPLNIIDDNKAFPLLKIISHFLLIAISLSLSKEQLKWIKEYQHFIISCLLINLIHQKSSEYKDKLIIAILTEIISFSFEYLIKQSCLYHHFLPSLTIISYFLSHILKQDYSSKQYIIPKILFKYLLHHKPTEKESKWHHLVDIVSFTSTDYDHEKIKEHYSHYSKKWQETFFDNRYEKFTMQYLDIKQYNDLLNKRKEQWYKHVFYYNHLKDYDPLMMIECNSIGVSYLKYKTVIEKDIELSCVKTLRAVNDLSFNRKVDERQLMNEYKETKKELFSWNGSWSQRELFYEVMSQLKYKMCNHYSSEYTKYLLLPIIDFDRYMPDFPRFNMKNIFHKANVYQINLDVYGMLYGNHDADEDEEENKNGVSIANSRSNSDCKEKNDRKMMNQSELIFKANYGNIWRRLQMGAYEPDERVQCCLVKMTQHIPGYFQLTKDEIHFDNIPHPYLITTPSPPSKDKNNNKPFDGYDHIRNRCYGSFIHHKTKYNQMPQKVIKVSHMKLLFKRKYFYYDKGLEIFTTTNKSFLFIFPSITARNTQLNNLLTLCKETTNPNPLKPFFKSNTNEVTAYITSSSPYNDFNDIIKSWEAKSLSTMEYIMLINLLSSRSFFDLTQYPILPWSLNNYSINPSHNDTQRDFTVPMGMMDIEDFEDSKKRKLDYIAKYEENLANQCTSVNDDYDELTEEAFCFGSHYSNPLYTTHYLTRLFPFPQIMLELQDNKFDDPSRLFLSIETSFKCAIAQKGDLRELIPEFYYLPEMFLNINNLNLGKTKIKRQVVLVNDVGMPSWCNNQAEFTSVLRENLELCCGEKISNWVDLIFGYKQRGEQAIKNNNTFQPYAYWTNLQFERLQNELTKASYLCSIELGVVPNQVFYNYKSPSQSQGNRIQLTESNDLVSYSTEIQYDRKIRPIAIFPYNSSSSGSSSSTLLSSYVIVFDNFSMKIFDMIEKKHKAKYCEVDTKHNNNSNNTLNEGNCLISIKSHLVYSSSNPQQVPIQQFNNDYYAIGGFWDGRLLLVKYPNTTIAPHFIYNPRNDHLITHIEIYQQHHMIICGTYQGTISLYTIQFNTVKYHRTLYHHHQRITSMSLNQGLNLLASSSIDGMIFIYSLPSFTIVRAMKVNGGSYADWVFLSVSPLPCIVYYSTMTSIFSCYSINGQFVCQVNEPCAIRTGSLVTPIVFKDCHSCDHLVYFTTQGILRFRKFPMLTLKEHNIAKSIKGIKILHMTEDNKKIFIQGEKNELQYIQDLSTSSITKIFKDIGFKNNN